MSISPSLISNQHVSNLSGDPNRHFDFEGFPDRSPMSETLEFDHKIFKPQSSTSPVLATTAGTLSLPDATHTRRPIALQVPSTCSTSTVEFPSSRVPSVLGRRDRRRSLVVVRRKKIKRRSSSSLPTPRPNVLVRCIRSGMGSSLGQPVSIGTLVRRGSPNLYQPQRTSSNTEGLTSFQGKSLLPVSSSLCRQHDGSGIPAESGRNSVELSECSSQRDLNLGGEQCHSSPTTVCDGSKECVSRLSVSFQTDNWKRMDSKSESSRRAAT